LSLSKLFAWLWAAVVAGLLAHNAYLWLGQRFAIETDILALLPAERRDAVLQRAFTHMVDATQQRLMVLVGADDWMDALRAADAYAAVLAPHADLIRSDERITDQAASDWLASFQRRRLSLMTSRDEATLRDQPGQFWADLALTKLYSPFSGLKLTAWRDDPFGLFANWIQARAEETPVRPRDGRLSVKDGQRDYIVMPFTLRVPAFSVAGQQAVISVLEQARQATSKVAPTVEVIQAGVILHAAAAAEQARREMSIISIGSLAGVVLLTWVTFHSLKPIVLITLAIIIGFLGALSISSMLFNGIHIITFVFGASLIGVAEDYGIYFLCKRSGAQDRLDSRQLLRHILPALLLTLVTSVIGYMGLVLTPFPGLHQMAVFSVIGLIFSWLTVVLWFPTLVHASTLKSQNLMARYGSQLTRWPSFHFERRPLLTAVSFAGLALLAWACLDVQDDIRLLQNSPKKLIDDQLKVGKLLDLPAPAQFYLLRGDSAETVLQREEMLKQRLDPLIDDRQISGYHAISNWVPSTRLQVARRQLIEQSLLDQNGALRALAIKLGEDGSWVASIRAQWLGASASLLPEDFLSTPASEPWRYLWLGKAGNEYAAIVALRGVTKDSLPPLQRAGSGIEGVQWVDKVGEISAVLADYRRYMSWVLLLSYVAVYGLLSLRYGHDSWRVLAPTVVASIVTLTLLGVTGQGLQLFHVLGLMLVLGIGVDYGIFFQEPNSRSDSAAWLAAGVSALSTLLSFGLLGLSRTPPLQAFGLTMAIGIGAVTLLVPCFRSDTFERLGDVNPA
jgi:predicted exporter